MVSAKSSNKKTYRVNRKPNFVLILLCLILVFLGKLDLIAIRNIQGFLFDFWAPVTNVVNKPMREIAVIFEDVKSTGSLREQNLKLINENRRLKALNTKAKNQEEELLELRELLNLLPKFKNKIVTGRVVTAPGGIFANTVLINAGKDYGIKIGHPAVSSLGLIGYVVNVGLKTSRILLTIDINSMIPIYLTESNWPAVAKGNNGELLEIKFLSSEASPIDGETVETSGHGGRLPPGINVGKIVKGLSGEFYIKPSVNFQRITYLSIINNGKKLSDNYKKFQGFAPLQKPKTRLVFKGLDSSGTRQKGFEDWRIIIPYYNFYIGFQ